MKRSSLVFLGCTLAAAFLAACSGPPGGGVCTTNCGGTGDGSLLVTMTATPLVPPPNTNILAFSATIGGVSLTPSSGSAINVPLAGSTMVVDLTRLQSDTAYLGSILKAVPAGTYSNITLAVTNASVTYCVQLNPGNPGCVAGTTATVSAGVTAPVLSSSPFPLNVAANQTVGLRIQINLNNALTVNATTQVVTAVNLAASNVFSLSTIPPTASSLATNQLDFIEDFTGVVTGVSGSTVSIATSKHGSISAVANSSTFFSPNCTGFGFNNDITCVKSGHLASASATLNSDGTFTLLSYDPLETGATDWVEGTVSVVPGSPTQFEIVANDVFQASTASQLGSLNIGNRVTVNLDQVNGTSFGVDTQGLILPAEATTFASSSDTSVLRAGQTVAVHVENFTAANGTIPAIVTTDFVGLRFSRVGGNVLSSAPPNLFFIQNLAPYFGTTTQSQVQLNQAISPTTAPTNFDGATDASGIQGGQNVSIRALYFGPLSAIPFSAAKVRIR